MRYVSLFSGIEAASVAWRDLGWEPVAFSEVDPFCCKLLAERFPEVPNLGDIREIKWKELDLGAVDLVVGGSPCQSFSIAGGRESLDGESRLMFEYLRAVDDIRPRWVVWENVPGVLTTHDDAFGQLIDSLQDIGYGSLAWRVLDAQFFGLAQRRARVFVVGRLGEGGAAPAVLFERESVSGNTQSSGEKRASLAPDGGGGSPSSGQHVMANSQGKAIAFAQNTRDEVRLQGDGTISGALSAQPGMKQTTYVVQTANTTRNGLGVIEEVDAWHTSSRSEQADLGGQRSAGGRGSGLHAVDRR